MKVIVALVLAIGSAAALGSGPYLPSGWRPQGPSFYLPGEIQKPVDSPLKEIIVFENVASGSDALREYGPPKEISQNVISQGLPEVVTEQLFVIDQDKEAISAAVVEESSAEVSEQKSELVLEATTEAQFAEVQATEAIERIGDVELQVELTTVSYSAEADAIKSEEIQATVAAVEEKIEQVVVEEVEAVEVGVKNIAEALVNLENEIKAEQVQQSVEAVAEVKVNQEGSGSAQVPEGFLEYGPPGFREYGPPKGDELLRSAAVIIQEPSNAVTLENNEARRRRFSPKFRAQKNKKIH